MLPEGWPLFSPDVSWEDAQDALADLGDGLPLVPPTEPRLARMLEGVGEPALSRGHLAPLFGEITPAAVAYQCVLAGAEPRHLPIVLSALGACTAEAFNLLGIATTTGTPAVAVVVHGPIARELGLNDGTNCLGPGNRANACIGRAVSLALLNIAGARPGVGDMATMGQPAKYGLCFAESAEGLLPPFAEGDAVTVLGISGTAEVLPLRQDTVEQMLTPVAAAMWGALAASGGHRERAPLQQVFLFPPELARGARERGWDLARIQGFLAEVRPLALDASVPPWAGPAAHGLVRSPADIRPIVTGGAGVKMTHLPLWAGGTEPVTVPIVAH